MLFRAGRDPIDVVVRVVAAVECSPGRCRGGGQGHRLHCLVAEEAAFILSRRSRAQPRAAPVCGAAPFASSGSRPARDRSAPIARSLNLHPSGEARQAGASDLLLGAIRIPVPKPVREPNRCNLEPLKPETPKITLYLVLAQGRLTLQVVCLGLAHFRLPVRPPKSPSRPTRENPGRPCGGGLGGGSCGPHPVILPFQSRYLLTFNAIALASLHECLFAANVGRIRRRPGVFRRVWQCQRSRARSPAPVAGAAGGPRRGRNARPRLPMLTPTEGRANPPRPTGP